MTKRLTIALVALAMFVLVAVMPTSAYFYAVNTSINQGASVYIGEQGLNLSGAMNAYAWRPTSIGWWASAAQISSSAPTATYPLTDPLVVNSTTISYAAFGSYYGPWYAINSTGAVDTTLGAFFNVKDPQLSADVWDLSQGTQGGIAVSGKSVIQGDVLTFKIGTNMDNAVNQPLLRRPQKGDVEYWADIKLKTESGNTYTSLLNKSNLPNAINKQNIDGPSWYWGQSADNFLMTNWSTSAMDATGQLAYPAGTYTLTVESHLNNMNDNYLLGGAAYTGKTVSEAKTVTLVSNTVKITANKDTVVRSKPFSVTVTGRPNTNYHVWVKGTKTMTGAFDNQPPMISLYQAGVTQDFIGAAYDGVVGLPYIRPYRLDPAGDASNNAGGYLFQNSGSTTITGTVWNDVAKGNSDALRIKLGNGTYLYANVSMADSGTRTVQFFTTNWTKAQTYTIRVENNFGTGDAFDLDEETNSYKSDEVDVKVEKGAVTIVAAGDQSYYLGEEIKFSGTNTETSTTYLFITGPNLNIYGSNFVANPRTEANKVNKDHPEEITQASVLGDNTWSWKWGTANVALDAGT
jgi:hypothetical protein